MGEEFPEYTIERRLDRDIRPIGRGGSSADTGPGDAPFPGTIDGVTLLWRWPGKCASLEIRRDSKYAIPGEDSR